MATAETKQTIPERSAATTLLASRLAKCAIGDTVAYADLSAVGGVDVQGTGRGNLMSARRIVLAEHRMVFGAVHRVGLKRLDSVGIVDAANAAIHQQHRAAHRGLRKLACAEYESLDNAGKLAHNVAVSHLGMVCALTKQTAVRALASAIAARETPAKLSIAKTLEVFQAGMGHRNGVAE